MDLIPSFGQSVTKLFCKRFLFFYVPFISTYLFVKDLNRIKELWVLIFSYGKFIFFYFLSSRFKFGEHFDRPI